MSNESYWDFEEYYDEQYRKDVALRTAYDAVIKKLSSLSPAPSLSINDFNLEDEQFLRDCRIKVPHAD